MKAVQFERYGPPEVLQLVDVPAPRPAPTQLQIKVMAAGVNPADFKWRSGSFSDRVPLPLPHILGYDVAGVVISVGSAVTRFKVGDRVVSTVRGGYAEIAVAEEVAAARLPETLDFAAAAALPCAALSGVQMIDEWVRPRPGETVLVTGATGAVGRFAMHAALNQGARVVAAVRPAYFDEASALGATEVISLEARHAEGRIFDHVADSVGGPAVAALCRSLAEGGSIATVATDPIDPAGLKAIPTFRSYRAQDGVGLARIVDDAAAGRVTMPIARRLPLGAAAEAHHQMENGGARGKLILEP